MESRLSQRTRKTGHPAKPKGGMQQTFPSSLKNLRKKFPQKGRSFTVVQGSCDVTIETRKNPASNHHAGNHHRIADSRNTSGAPALGGTFQ